VLLCLLLLVLTGSPALAHCRPENRVWVFLEKSPDFASKENANPIAASGENPGCGYDFASGVHKYLYCQNDSIMGIDPSGHDLGDVMASLYVNASFAAMNMQATVMAYGGVATTVAILAQNYHPGDSGTMMAVTAGLDVVSLGGGQILRFPAWAQLSQLKNWTMVLYAEHAADAAASRQAMAAALQFSEQIVQGSLKVGGAGAQGADIVAQATVNGTTQTLMREVSVFQGDLTKSGGKGLYDKILDEAAQTAGAQIRQVFIQITDDVKSAPNWKQIVSDKVTNAKNVLGGVVIYVVDGTGRSVL